jgi:two-component system sensor histidine kinase/response regulator
VSEKTKIKVLYIDDERNNLISFKAMFRQDYDVLIAGSAEEGEKFLQEHSDIKIVFCDQRMPAKTGVEFFKEISQKYPDPIRMLITGYVDIESVINAINHGHVFRYLTKPWREEEVRSAIEEGYKYYSKSSLLNIKIQELQQANAELDKFTYSVTHDIRGPVVSILGALQILKTLDDVDEMKQLLDLMEQSAEKVKDLITNIHSYYNIKRGNLNINEINFSTLVEEIIHLHNVDALLNKVKITTQVEQTEKFRSDMTVLRLIFNNLINNAIKYQRRNEENKWVNLSLTVQKGVCYAEISDNGIGIPVEFKEEIFEMFFRATKQNVGSGFGLYNVKDALSKLGGKIEVETSVDVGTKFKITIPTK